VAEQGSGVAEDRLDADRLLDEICGGRQPRGTARADIIDLPAAGRGSASWAELVSTLNGELHRGNLALLVGSAVSAHAPSGVPVAGDASSELLRRLIALIDPALQPRVRRALRDVPFEVLMGRLKEVLPARAFEVVGILADMADPNPVDRQIADLLLQAAHLHAPLSVITSNYDQGIELAVRALTWPDGRPPSPTVWLKDLALNTSGREIFHIHGIVGDDASYVLDFRDEFALEPWKVNHLARLVRGRTLVVLGFSGWDLDISEAIRSAHPGSLVWFRRTAPDCDSGEWSLAAQALVADVISRSGRAIAVNVDGRIEGAFEPFTFRVVPSSDLAAEALFEARYQRMVPPDGPDWARLWIRWAALRAGLAELGENLAADERGLLGDEQAIEFRSFHNYYGARHKDGARLQRRAARKARHSGAPIPKVIYHRNLEAEFLNRGAYTIDAIRVVFGTLAATEARILTGRTPLSPALLSELLNLSASLVTAWPMYPLTLASPRFRSVSQGLGRFVSSALVRRAFDKEMIVRIGTSPAGSQEYLRARERYMWLGLRPRLINLSRRAAFSTIWENQRSLSDETIRAAEKDADCAMSCALIASDPVRLAKCTLLLIEIVNLLRSRSLPPEPSTLRVFDEARSRGFPPTVDRAWLTIESSQVWSPVRTLGQGVYQLGVRRGRQDGLRARLLGIAILETS
jgi:hypothetical protein